MKMTPIAPAPTKTIVLCTDERTGSHLLAQIMASTGALGRPLEFFNTQWMAKQFPDYPSDVADQMERAKSIGTTPNGVFSLKLHPWAYDLLSSKFDVGTDLPDARFVLLHREDLLGQAISLLKARQTQAYASDQPVMAEPRYDAAQLDVLLKDLAMRRARWDVFFARNGISPLRLRYEDLIERPQEIAEAVAAFAGVDGPVRVGAEEWFRFERQADKTSDEWRERYTRESRNTRFLDQVEARKKKTLGQKIRRELASGVKKLARTFQRPTADTWLDASNYDLAWSARAEAALPLITGSHVADIGCGPHQALRSLLPAGTQYLPADQTAWTDDTEVCDLNSGRYPERSISACETAVLLGVLEYVRDFDGLLKALSPAREIVFSYNTADEVPRGRNPLWVNKWTHKQIAARLSKTGLHITGEIKHGREWIARAERKVSAT